jgi:hypothetical protein
MTVCAPSLRPTVAPQRARGPDERTAHALAAGTIERILAVITGRRSLNQIGLRVTGPVAGLINALRGRNPLGGSSYRVRSVHACLTTSHRVEACAVIATASRTRALVMRMDQAETAWSCTMLAVV